MRDRKIQAFEHRCQYEIPDCCKYYKPLNKRDISIIPKRLRCADKYTQLSQHVSQTEHPDCSKRSRCPHHQDKAFVIDIATQTNIIIVQIENVNEVKLSNQLNRLDKEYKLHSVDQTDIYNVPLLYHERDLLIGTPQIERPDRGNNSSQINFNNTFNLFNE